MALVKNEDLLNMTRLGRASRPLDLMSYTPEDEMPSTFLLQESKRVSVLTVFNWTEKPRERKIDLVHDLGLQSSRHNQVSDVLDSSGSPGSNLESIELQLPPHSVKLLKIIDSSIAAAAPGVTVRVPEKAETGTAIQFSAESDPAGVPVLSYRWDFGDGTHAEGAAATHSYTYAGDFTVRLAAKGLDGIPFEKSMSITVEGKIGTRFVPAKKVRLGRPD